MSVRHVKHASSRRSTTTSSFIYICWPSRSRKREFCSPCCRYDGRNHNYRQQVHACGLVQAAIARLRSVGHRPSSLHRCHYAFLLWASKNTYSVSLQLGYKTPAVCMQPQPECWWL